jgi:hypothetical protein
VAEIEPTFRRSTGSGMSSEFKSILREVGEPPGGLPLNYQEPGNPGSRPKPIWPQPQRRRREQAFCRSPALI